MALWTSGIDRNNGLKGHLLTTSYTGFDIFYANRRAPMDIHRLKYLAAFDFNKNREIIGNQIC